MKKYYVIIACFIFLLGAAVPADALLPGSYTLLIEETPELYLPGSGIPDVGVDGNWNTSFTFGGLPSQYSTRCIDNPNTTNNYGYGTGETGLSPNTYGDGWAGAIDITLDGAGNFTVDSLQVDVVPDTAGGNFAQYGPVWSMNGSIDAAGNITFDPTGRFGHIDGPEGGATGKWSVDDMTTPGSTAWVLITTGTATGPSGSVTGSPIWTDEFGDMWAVLVTGAAVGSEWGPYAGHAYYEIWRVKIQSTFDPCEGNTCDDGDPCNGVETCDGSSGAAVCVPGTPINCTPLPAGTLLTIDTGFNGKTSFFTMAASTAGLSTTIIRSTTTAGVQHPNSTDGGLLAGIAQPAGSCGHAGGPTAADFNSIDKPWSFFGNTGMHFDALGITANPGAGTIDMTNAWFVAWAGICAIDVGGDLLNTADTGIGDFTVSGTNYTVDYNATVPLCDPSGFGGVPYALHLEGRVVMNGLCAGITCDDSNLCTNDTCDPATGLCDYVPNTAPCDDGDACTENDTCSNGVCIGTSTSSPEGPAGDPTCSDGIDNDCDGLTDLEDTDCGAVNLPAGDYSLLLEETPAFMGNPTIANVGSPGAWNTSFTFGGPPGWTSARLIDNPVLSNDYGYGTGDDGLSPNTFGDGWAGIIHITLDSTGNFIVNSYQMDVVDWTSGGNYAQFGPVTAMGGNIDSLGNMVFNPTGRRGAIDGPPGGWVADFNIDDFTDTTNTSVWDTYTTGTVTGGISGSPITVNGQGQMWASLVSTGAIGSQWNGYYGYPYYDLWKVKIVPGTCSVEGPAGNATCSDGLDNDCDGLTDSEDPHCGSACLSNADCGNTSLYCAKAPGNCSGTGNCEIKPTACPPVIDTVCGCNGTTYSDSCTAAAEGSNVSYTGECASVCTDFDGDGYSIEGGDCGPVDCDISNPNINPGATEVCDDNVDNDCDNLIDTADPDCALCTGLQSVTIRGGGQRPTTTDLQIQVQFTVLGTGGILSNTDKVITVCPGTVLAYNNKVGDGPEPSEGTMDGVPINPNSLSIIIVDAQHKLILTNKGNGGRDTDRITIQPSL